MAEEKKVYLMVSIETVDGEETTFTIPKEDLCLPEFGIMYTIRKATNPKETKSIIIPWHRISKVYIDDMEEEENVGK